MTFSGDKLESLSTWGKARSYLVLAAIVITFSTLIIWEASRGYALMGLALLVIIMFHETGHFLAAKWAKMKATEFFVGFGPRIWSFKKGETEYGIKAIPLGGYVKIIGMTNLEEVDEEDEDRTYRKSTAIKKLIVVLAGVTINVLLAILLIYTLFVGKGVPVDTATSRAIIEVASPNTPGAKAGLTRGDEITRINDTRIASFDQLVETVQKYKVGDKVEVQYIRNGETRTATMELGARPDQNGKPTDTPFIGVNRQLEYQRMGFLEAIPESFKYVYRVVDVTVGALTDRFSASGINEYSEIIVNGEHERADRPSSVIGIVDSGGNLVEQDGWYLIEILAAVNVVLALLNILPLLPFDGGHAMVVIYESVASRITKRKVVADYRKLMPLTSIVFFVFGLIALSAFWLDILQVAS